MYTDLELETKWSEDDQMFVTTFPQLKASPKFQSRYLLWSKAHALQWMAECMYAQKIVPAEVVPQER